MHRAVLHVDMDAFYASVEVLLNPALEGKAVIVGGSARGVVASCSYEARAYGVRSAMPSVRARRLCPHAVFVPGHHGVYGDYSARLHEVFHELTPLVEGIALDEAFLDVSALVNGRRSRSAADVAVELRRRVHDRVALRCSVGVATCKLLAKLASEEAKPPTPPRPGVAPERRMLAPGAVRHAEGVVVIEPQHELAFLHSLPVRALWGVGPATFARLARYGVVTVGDLAALPEDVVIRALGASNGAHLHALAWGRDERPVEPERPLKSVGHEETFAADHHDVATLRTEALRMADAVASRLRSGGHRGRTVTVKVRFGDFRTITRSRTLAVALDTAPILYDTACALLADRELVDQIGALGVRLLGVSVANLVDDAGPGAAGAAEQLDLFGPGPESASDASARGRGAPAGASAAAPPLRDEAEERALAATVDAIRERFGAAAVGPAALTTGTGLRVKRPGETPWGPPAPDDPEPAPPQQ